MVLPTLGFEGAAVEKEHVDRMDEVAREALDLAMDSARDLVRRVRSIAGLDWTHGEPEWLSELLVAVDATHEHVKQICRQVNSIAGDQINQDIIAFRDQRREKRLLAGSGEAANRG